MKNKLPFSIFSGAMLSILALKQLLMIIVQHFLFSLQYQNSVEQYLNGMKRFDTNNIRKFKIEDIQISKTLGRGGFGKVKLAKIKRGQKQKDSYKDKDKYSQYKFVAMKVLRKAQVIEAQQEQHVANQYHILSQINHPFIVNFEGFCQDSKHLYFVMQFVNGGELYTFIRQSQTLSTQQCRFYAGIVTVCLEYLHSKNIIYRDLKPQNLLLANDGYLKLTDFGFAKILNQGRTFTICGTPQYIAPEVILNQGHGKAVDWWALGILIYEMYVGIDPFSDEDAMAIYKNILRGKVTFPASLQKQNKHAKSIIKHLLMADLSKRYGNLKDGVNDIKKHKWFEGFRWEDLLEKKIKPSYIPQIKSPGDYSKFEECPDSNIVSNELKCSVDPFLNW